MLIRKPLFYMAEGGDGAGAGEGSPSGDAGGGGGQQQPSAEKGEPGGKPDEGKTFTQAELDRILQGRLAKYADYDDVKAKLAEVEAANQTEQEKAVNQAREEGRREARLEAGRELAREAFNGFAARRNDEYDTTSALDLLSLDKFLKDDGALDRDAIKEAVERLVPEKQEAKPAPTFGGGPRRSSADKADVKPGMGRLRAAYADQ